MLKILGSFNLNYIKIINLNFILGFKYLLRVLRFIYIIYYMFKIVIFIISYKNYYSIEFFYLLFSYFYFWLIIIFILNGFKYSKVKFIKILQKLAVVSIFLFISFFCFLFFFWNDLILDYSAINFSNSGESDLKKMTENQSSISRITDETTGEKSTVVKITDSDAKNIFKNISEQGLKQSIDRGVDKAHDLGNKLVTNIGAGALGAALGTAALKSAVNTFPGSPSTKLTAGLIAGGLGGAIGILSGTAGKAMADNMKLGKNIKDSENLINPIDRTPSPEPNFDQFTKCVLESNELNKNSNFLHSNSSSVVLDISPLETILICILFLIIIGSIFILYNIFLLIYIYSKNYIINIITNQGQNTDLNNQNTKLELPIKGDSIDLEKNNKLKIHKNKILSTIKTIEQNVESPAVSEGKTTENKNILDKFLIKLLNYLFKNENHIKKKTKFGILIKKYIQNKIYNLNNYSNNFIYFIIFINLIFFLLCLFISVILLFILLGGLDDFCTVHLNLFTNN